MLGYREQSINRNCHILCSASAKPQMARSTPSQDADGPVRDCRPALLMGAQEGLGCARLSAHVHGLGRGLPRGCVLKEIRQRGQPAAGVLKIHGALLPPAVHVLQNSKTLQLCPQRRR